MSNVAVKRTGKCSKPKGVYCRLHNPAPKQRFISVDDVFQKAKEASKTQKEPVIPEKNEYNFQSIKQVRMLDTHIPAHISEHIAISEETLNKLEDDKKLALKGYTGFAAGVCNNVLQGNGYDYYDEAPLWRESEGPCDFVTREDLVDYFKTMDDVLKTRQPNRRTIYRGIPIYASLHDEIGAAIGKKLSVKDTEGLVEGLKEYYKPGKVFNNKTYLSTTHSAYFAAERSENWLGTKQTYWDKAEISGIVYELHTNAGLDITGACERTSFEREVLLPRDTYFKVVNLDIKPEEYKTVSGYDKLRKPGELQHKTFKNLAVVVQMVEVDKDGKEILHSKDHKPSVDPESFVP